MNKTTASETPGRHTTPTGLSREGPSTIVITWSDGSTTSWTAQRLRDACPCATCREKRRGPDDDDGPAKKPMGLPVLSAAEAQPLTITSMSPVGTYAYNITFSDGHSSGIFTFDRLRGDA